MQIFSMFSSLSRCLVLVFFLFLQVLFHGFMLIKRCRVCFLLRQFFHNRQSFDEFFQLPEFSVSFRRNEDDLSFHRVLFDLLVIEVYLSNCKFICSFKIMFQWSSSVWFSSCSAQKINFFIECSCSRHKQFYQF